MELLLLHVRQQCPALMQQHPLVITIVVAADVVVVGMFPHYGDHDRCCCRAQLRSVIDFNVLPSRRTLMCILGTATATTNSLDA